MENYYRQNIVEFALLQLEKKYKESTQGPEEFDNIGLIKYIYKTLFNIDITPYLNIKNKELNKKINIGDILIFKEKENAYDYALYIDKNKILHASKKENKVIISPYKSNNLITSKNVISKLIDE